MHVSMQATWEEYISCVMLLGKHLRGRKGDRINYDGAMVYDPLSEGTNGLHQGVAAFDFAGLYPL